MKSLFNRVARVVSCILLPIGTAFLFEAIIAVATDTGPFSFQWIGRILIVGAILFLLPIVHINSTEPLTPDGSNSRLIKRLTLIGIVPVLLAFVFFTLIWTHD